jgi:predicted nucleic acid-binding Zn ribbon protein
MSKGKRPYRASRSQIIFSAIGILIILSVILSLIVKL